MLQTILHVLTNSLISSVNFSSCLDRCVLRAVWNLFINGWNRNKEQMWIKWRKKTTVNKNTQYTHITISKSRKKIKLFLREYWDSKFIFTNLLLFHIWSLSRISYQAYHASYSWILLCQTRTYSKFQWSQIFMKSRF